MKNLTDVKKLPIAFTGALMIALTGAGAAQAGILYFSEDSNSNGLYTLNTSNGAATNIGISGVTNQTVGLAPSADPEVLYGSQWFNILEINADGTGFTTLGPADAEGLGFDPTTGILYGAINGEFFSIDTTSGTINTNLASPGADVEGLDYGNGVIYGLAAGGALFSYNIGGNSWLLIGNTGINFDQVGLAFDSELGILYAKGNQNSLLYSIDPTTAAATVIGDTGIANGGGLAFVADSAPVPEPTSVLSLLTLGALGAGSIIKRKLK